LTGALEVEAEAPPTSANTAPDPARPKPLVPARRHALPLCHLDAAAPPIGESLEIYKALGDRKGVARSYSALATLAAYKGDFAASRQYGQTGLELYRENGDQRGVAVALHNLGYLALLQRDWGAAGPAYEEALGILRRVGDEEHIALTLADLAVASQGLDQPERARAELAEALDLVKQLGARREGAYALEAAAALAEAWGDPGRAARYAGAAAALREAIGSPLVPLERGEREALLGRLENALGGPEFAREHGAGRGEAFEPAMAAARAWLGVPRG
jgi:tetratricopeptide (TPR) repeat protein